MTTLLKKQLSEKNLSGQKIALTGATGFLGQYMVDRLLKHQAEVVAVVRNPDKVPALKNLDIEFRKADLGDKESLSKAFDGVDAVISNAGQVGAANFSEMVSNNVGGTENVFNAMRDAGVKRCVQTSSGSIYRYVKSNQVIDESFSLRTPSDRKHYMSSYPISKAMAENKAWDLAKEYGITLSTLRPFGIYGAFDSGTFMKWFKLLMKLPITPFPVGIDVALIYAGDVAESACLMLENEKANNQAYNICGGELDIWHFYNLWKQAGGKTSYLRIPFPLPMKQIATNNKAQQDLGWAPSSIVDACKEIIASEQRGSHW